MMFTIYEIIVIFPLLHQVICLKEFDPKCRYTVHLPEASWHTAYDVCQGRNKTLANISVLDDLYMVDLVIKEVDALLINSKGDIFSSGVWFDGCIRVSNQGNTVETCKSLDCSLPVRTTSMGVEDGMLCLYYNRTDLNIYPEDCNNSKAFLCESKHTGPQSCLQTSKKEIWNDSFPYNLCRGYSPPSTGTKKKCESECFSRSSCYTITYTQGTCVTYEIYNGNSCSVGNNLPVNFTHKSIFLFNGEDYVLSRGKPLAEWCTEPRMLPRNNTTCHEALSVLDEDSWKTYGPKCRYTVHIPEASWYTAYDVCEQNNQILAEITSLSEMYIMEDLLNEIESLFYYSVINVSVDLWIGGFMQIANKEILTRDCKSLTFSSAIHIPEKESTEEIACLYYNRTAMIIYTDDCHKTRPFICERKETGPSSCMETSATASLKDSAPQKLCFYENHFSITNTQMCESKCIQHFSCYTTICKRSCILYEYKDDPFCHDMGRYPPISLRHKSFFKFSSSDFPISNPKPFAELCPEPKKIMVLQEKSCNVPTRTTPESFLISRGWESIEIFNDLNGDMKSKMAVVLDNNDGTCFSLPTQEDFTPFLMMRMPTEPVFGIRAKAFTITISGMGISCNRHSNYRMLQVSYRAIREPTQFCTLTDNKAVPDAFSRCVFRCDCPDPAHCRDVNLYLASGNAKGAWSLCEVKATNS